MKTKIEIAESNFQPLRLIITIETQEELSLLRDMFSCDISVPQACYADEKLRAKLASLLSQMYRTLCDSTNEARNED